MSWTTLGHIPPFDIAGDQHPPVGSFAIDDVRRTDDTHLRHSLQRNLLIVRGIHEQSTDRLWIGTHFGNRSHDHIKDAVLLVDLSHRLTFAERLDFVLKPPHGERVLRRTLRYQQYLDLRHVHLLFRPQFGDAPEPFDGRGNLVGLRTQHCQVGTEDTYDNVRP